MKLPAVPTVCEIVHPPVDWESLPWMPLAHGKSGYAMINFPKLKDITVHYYHGNDWYPETDECSLWSYVNNYLDCEMENMFTPGGWKPDVFRETAMAIAAIILQVPDSKEHYNILLSRLTPGQVIPEHVDAAYHKRVHVPLKTNPEAFFITEGKRVHMKVGRAYLVDPSKPHGVVNEGHEDRIHLMFDLAG